MGQKKEMKSVWIHFPPNWTGCKGCVMNIDRCVRVSVFMRQRFDDTSFGRECQCLVVITSRSLTRVGLACTALLIYLFRSDG